MIHSLEHPIDGLDVPTPFSWDEIRDGLCVPNLRSSTRKSVLSTLLRVLANYFVMDRHCDAMPKICGMSVLSHYLRDTYKVPHI